MEIERVSYRNRLNDAQIRLASYRPRLGEVFAFTVELALKKAELDGRQPRRRRCGRPCGRSASCSYGRSP
jgi:hypothetical protein